MDTGVEVYTQIEAARTQLERAILLFSNERDYLSAITLAGAAEEPLGKMLKEETGTNRFEHQVDMIARIQEHFGEEVTTRKQLISEENFVRDWLKHRKEWGDLEFNAKEEAHAMIERAVSTYVAVTHSVTEIMRPFFTFNADAA